MDAIERIRQANEQRADKSIGDQRHGDMQLANLQTQETIVKSFQALVDYLDGKTSKTEVTNQIESVKTPDALKVAESVESLHKTLKSYKGLDLSVTVEALNKILEQSNTDYTEDFKNLADMLSGVEEAIKTHETNVEAPIVNVDAPIVKVDAPNLKPLQEAINKLSKEKLKVTPQNTLIKEEFDEWRITLNKDDEPIGIKYFLNNKKVAELQYKIKDEMIVGVKKVKA